MKNREEFSADEVAKMAKAIQAKRRAAGLSQQELAERLRYSVAAIRKWESGKAAPRAEVAVALAAALGTTLEGLHIGSARKQVAVRAHPSLDEFLLLTPDIRPEHEAELRAVDSKGGDPGVAFYSLLYQAIRAREQHQTAHAPALRPTGGQPPPAAKPSSPGGDFAGRWLAGLVAYEAECGALRPAVRERLLAMRHNAGEIADVGQAIRDAVAEDAVEHPEDHGGAAREGAKRGAQRGPSRAKPLPRKRR